MPDDAGKGLDEARAKDRLAIIDRGIVRVEARKAKVVVHDVVGEVALREADREARRPLGRHLSAHDLNDGRRVDPAREKRAKRDVAHELSLDRTLDRGSEFTDLRLVSLSVQLVTEIPVPLDLGPSVVGDMQKVAGLELLHAQEGGVGIWNPPPTQIAVDPGRVETRLDACSQQSLDLGRDDECAVRTSGVVERLDAQTVAREDGCASPPVVEAEREHAVDALEQSVSPLVPAVHEHFGIGARSEPVATGLELTSQVAEVEDLAVEDDPDISVFVCHRLEARVAEVDDREPRKGEHRATTA